MINVVSRDRMTSKQSHEHGEEFTKTEEKVPDSYSMKRLCYCALPGFLNDAYGDFGELSLTSLSTHRVRENIFPNSNSDI